MPGRLVTLGEALVTVGSTEAGTWAVGSVLRLSFAGAESNVATGVARLGHPACWIGRLGNDPGGDLVLRELRAEGIDVSLVTRDPDAPTALLLREQRTGDRAGVRYLRSGSAGSKLSPADIGPQVFEDAALLHVTGITAGLGAGPRATVGQVTELARARGTTISLDVNYRAKLWSAEEAAQVLAPLSRAVTIVFGGPEELALLSTSGNTDPARIADELLGSGVREVVLKDGSRGATAYFAESSGGKPVRRSCSAEAIPVTVVDPVGAGDAFVAGYLSGELDGLAVPDKLDRGTRLGAVAVSTRGDWEGLPRRGELDLLLTGPDVRR